jgi:hypothetical protein
MGKIFADVMRSTPYGRYKEFLEVLIRYILEVSEAEHQETVVKQIYAVNKKEVEKAYMTIADKLRKEGQIQDKQQVLSRLLSKKYRLTKEEKEKVSGVFDAKKLNLALDEIVVAETKEQVLKLLE